MSHKIRTQVQYKKQILEILENSNKPLTLMGISKALGVAYGSLSNFQTCNVGRAFKELRDNGYFNIQPEKRGRAHAKNYYSLATELKIPKERVLPPSFNDTKLSPEECLMLSINQYLAIKKQEMEKDIEQKLGEAEYYKNLSEKYKQDIDELQGKLDSRKFLGINWS
jgi:DNA-binding transcriptional regulator GbsR (MarR family)